MGTSDYDWKAKDLASANRGVIEKMIDYLQNHISKSEIPSQAKQFIKSSLLSSSNFVDFHENIGKGLVQVDELFKGEIENETSILKYGYRWEILFRIDADVPPPTSTQKKHIGFEIHFQRRKLVVGHAWCEDVPCGRPGTDVQIPRSADHQNKTIIFHNGDKAEWHSYTYSL